MLLVVDDHPLARQGLISIIQMYKKDEVVLHAGSIHEATAIMEQREVASVFIDLILGRENGITLLAWVKEHKPQVKTFVITSSSRESDFVSARNLDVDAYVLKDAFVDEILFCLKVVERGGKFYSTELIDMMNKHTDDENMYNMLTEREMEVFLLLGQGYSNAKISETLYIASGTTKKHISSILSKLHLKSRVDAALLSSSNSYNKRQAIHKSIRHDLRTGGQSL